MKEGFLSDNQNQEEQLAPVGGNMHIPQWDPNGDVPPPLPAENPPEPTWIGKEMGLPPPLPSETLENNWEGKELGLPPPLPQEHNGEAAVVDNEVQDTANIESNEDEIPEPNIPVLDRELCGLGLGPGGVYSEQWEERLAEFINEKRNLPPDATIDLYHGLNGGIEGALAVIQSPEQGVKQISGPCLAVYPLGQFWKPGGAGFKYSIPRESIEFPGENKSDAKFRIDDEGIVFLVNGLDTLPLTEFNGEVMRTERTEDVFAEGQDPSFDSTIEPIGKKVVPLSRQEKEVGLKIEEQLGEFSQAREEEQVRRLEESIRAGLGGE